MAIIKNNNVGNVKFLRNGSLYGTHNDAYTALTDFNLTSEQDGTIILARYGSGNDVKTLAGLVYVNGENKSITIIDIEGASGDVNKLREEINAKLGEGVSSANTVTAQLTALSGNSSTDTSATTSVEGAKKYAYDLIGTLDGSITAETGYYVKSVSEVDGKISGTTEALPSVNDTAVAGEYVSQVTQTNGAIAVTRVALPSVNDTAVAKKFVVAVDETNGQIAVERGEISSSAGTMVLTDNDDGGVNFEVNIDNNTIIQDAGTKKLKVADAALVQYEGDTKTIAISPVQNGVRTVSSIITLSSITPSSTTVKEEYALKNASGETIGSTIKIYKDSSIVKIKYITDPADEHYQNLEYIYIDASGDTKTEYVDMSSLVLEAEFASGVTFSDGVAHGVVDSDSESFLTVGANGFKLAGVQGAIDSAVNALDATVNNNANSGHVAVEIVETDGKLVSVTVTEDDIASADDIEELSAKTVTEIASSNSSISATSAATADGTVKYDVVTDANKIKMSGFTAETSGFTAITEASTITEAVKAIETEIIANEQTVSTALNNLRTDIDTVSGDVEDIADDVETISGKVDTIDAKYVSGVSVNGNAVKVANHVAPISISAATSATTAETSNAIVVDTDAKGNITLGLNYIDCGTY